MKTPFYILHKTPRRKSISLTVNDEAQIVVRSPKWVSKKEIDEFVISRETWISKVIEEMKAREDILKNRFYDEGGEFLFLGQKIYLSIKTFENKRVKVNLDGDCLTIFLSKEIRFDDRENQIQKALIKWYREQALEYFGVRALQWARKLGHDIEKVGVRTQKRMWGVCYPDRKMIILNWLLIMASRDVIDYVIVHELCHLKVPNHSKYFWNEVEFVLPDYKKCVKWLKDNQFKLSVKNLKK